MPMDRSRMPAVAFFLLACSHYPQIYEFKYGIPKLYSRHSGRDGNGDNSVPRFANIKEPGVVLD